MLVEIMHLDCDSVFLLASEACVDDPIRQGQYGQQPELAQYEDQHHKRWDHKVVHDLQWQCPKDMVPVVEVEDQHFPNDVVVRAVKHKVPLAFVNG